jgi:hypothetical protein
MRTSSEKDRAPARLSRQRPAKIALKGAETDATKRALATFGNPFGLALYDPKQNGVRKLRSAQDQPGNVRFPWMESATVPAISAMVIIGH